MGDIGPDGRISHVAAAPTSDTFEAVKMHEDREKGSFVALDLQQDTVHEIDAFFSKSGKAIVALTFKEILEKQIAKKPT